MGQLEQMNCEVRDLLEQEQAHRHLFASRLAPHCSSGFRGRGIWLEPEPSLWPGSTLNIFLIIHENYMELNII